MPSTAKGQPRRQCVPAAELLSRTWGRSSAVMLWHFGSAVSVSCYEYEASYSSLRLSRRRHFPREICELSCSNVWILRLDIPPFYGPILVHCGVTHYGP